MELIRSDKKVTLLVDEKEAGRITYYEEKGKLVVDSTFVDPVHRGKDFGLKLVDEVVDIARSMNTTIIPVCPYVEKVFLRYEKYHDVHEKKHDKGVSCNVSKMKE